MWEWQLNSSKFVWLTVWPETNNDKGKLKLCGPLRLVWPTFINKEKLKKDQVNFSPLSIWKSEKKRWITGNIDLQTDLVCYDFADSLTTEWNDLKARFILKMIIILLQIILRSLACCYFTFEVKIKRDNRVHFINHVLGTDAFLRFDRPHYRKNITYHHININSEYSKSPDPHTRITQELFDVSWIYKRNYIVYRNSVSGSSQNSSTSQDFFQSDFRFNDHFNSIRYTIRCLESFSFDEDVVFVVFGSVDRKCHRM